MDAIERAKATYSHPALRRRPVRFRFAAGKSFRATITAGACAVRPIGSKSRAESYLTFGVSTGTSSLDHLMAPAIRATAVMECRPEPDSERASLGLDVERPDDVAPLLGFVGDELAKVGERAPVCQPNHPTFIADRLRLAILRWVPDVYTENLRSMFTHISGQRFRVN